MITDDIKDYINDIVLICSLVNIEAISNMTKEIIDVKKRQGRMFILGVGGSAANASHAVNDFRKILGIEAYAPTDNISELSARTNDDGWESVFIEWLKISKLCAKDLILVLSVGGGSNTVSFNIVKALQYAQQQSCKILSIVSRDGGYTKSLSDICVLIPVINEKLITPHAEEWQAILWHMIVSIIEKNNEN